MQTFLTDKSFKQTASSLDDRRLNKQRVETFQIYNAARGIRLDTKGNYVGPAIGWRNHPAVRMWRGHESLLCIYGYRICLECDHRGIADHAGLSEFFRARMHKHEYIVPSWWADPLQRDKLTFTHRCNLVRKDPEFYRPKFPDVPDNYEDIAYWWPL